jgi:sugar lactone lactonase YvrE
MEAEQASDPVTYHGEGPVWSPRWGGLRWVDLLAGDVLSLRADGGIARRHISDVVAALRPRRGGGAILGVGRGFALEDADGNVTQLAELWGDPGVRMNDGACDPHGRFYCGSMAYDKRPKAGALYRIDPAGSVFVVRRDVTISNGLAWSPDGTRAYYVDTATYQITVFAYTEAAGFTAAREFVAFTPADGRPDGLTVDAMGGVWVAMNGAGTVRRYTPGGALDDVVHVPVPKVTACTFGGSSLDVLYITTSREGLLPDEQKLAGALFQARVGVAGQPALEFAG